MTPVAWPPWLKAIRCCWCCWREGRLSTECPDLSLDQSKLQHARTNFAALGRLLLQAAGILVPRGRPHWPVTNKCKRHAKGSQRFSRAMQNASSSGATVGVVALKSINRHEACTGAFLNKTTLWQRLRKTLLIILACNIASSGASMERQTTRPKK